jgi:hypothetical protein
LEVASKNKADKLSGNTQQGKYIGTIYPIHVTKAFENALRPRQPPPTRGEADPQNSRAHSNYYVQPAPERSANWESARIMRIFARQANDPITARRRQSMTSPDVVYAR